MRKIKVKLICSSVYYFHFLFILQCESLLSSWYKAREVDTSVVVMESFPTSRSLVECVAYCNIAATSCKVVEYDGTLGTCTSLDHGAITLANPSRLVYVHGNHPSKSKALVCVCLFVCLRRGPPVCAHQCHCGDKGARFPLWDPLSQLLGTLGTRP